ncbi:reverse transcriptase domain-containing protein [Trichonephila inaurata madagascariensis]|uniref:Reverse transcriptase domain-containing protein n=1 Tax=Trichonephila inaurata madagascariensis TaxID=2747483 RepID=A0A8X6WVV7_9ARAC|nr:reverse transcriptase domain-containing protein [Trichonephila inaurata madagascariensis]
MNRKIDELKDQYYDIKDISESELEVIEADIQSMEDRLEVRMRDILNSLIAKSSVSSVHNHENAISQANSKLKLEVKLPEIPLPVFRGGYDEWPSLKSQFDNVITNNNDLNESQKLYYLKASLQCDSKLLEAVDDSFESLITALKTCFENKRLLTETHINAILEIEKLTSESARDIRSMTDILNKNIRALKLLDFEQHSLEEEICETQYPNTHYRNEEERYVVQLPFKKDPYCLGNSRFMAEIRLNHLWKKLLKHYDLQTLYKSFLKEYIDLNHMQLVADPLEINISYFLPHHRLFHPDSKTTKLIEWFVIPLTKPHQVFL